MTKYGWIYDLIYPDFLKRMKSQNDLLMQEMSKNKLDDKTVLELGSGSGRQSWLLQRQGCNVHALEICKEMVELGSEKLGPGRIQVGDARNFETSEKVSAVLIGPLAACYFLNNEDLRRSLSCAKNSLAKGGLLFVDFIHSKIVLEDEFYDGFSNQQFTFSAPDRGIKKASVNRFSECHLDLVNDVKYSWKATYIFDYDGKISTDEDYVLLRTFFPSEVEILLQSCGFRNVRFFGCDGEQVFPLGGSSRLVSFIALAEA
jgi:trans-aconitate methyltransferase